MGDVADMLGLSVQKANAPTNAAEEAIKFIADSKAKMDNKGSASNNTALSSKASMKKPKGMKREVFDLLGKDGVIPAVQSSTTSAAGFKTKRTIASKGKWIYVPIESSARTDNQLTFKHWVKADINYTDYPYAKFNVKLEKVSFSDEEYQSLLNDENWTKEDTQRLIDMCHLYDLRWPVIFDRLTDLSVPKTPEEMQSRFYGILNKLHSARDQQATGGSGSNSSSKLYEYDYEKETKRRMQQDLMFKRTREEEQEELKLREELKLIDATIKKNKKTTKASAPATVAETAKATEGASTTAPVVNSGEVSGVLLASVTNPMTDAVPTPQPGKPCLQSSRLYLSDGSVPMAKSIVAKMNAYLKELNIPERPVATKRVCDLVDQVRKDSILLISLHSSIKKKEKELITAKGGNARSQSKSQPKVKQEKAEKADKAETKTEKSEKSRKGSTKKAAAAVATADIDDSALDALGGDLLPLDGKDEFGDLLDVFDPHDSFHDVDVKPAAKATTTKKRARASKAADGKIEESNVEPSEAAPAVAPAKKKTKKGG